MRFIKLLQPKSEHKANSEQQSEHQSEQLQAAPQAKANTTNSKMRARTYGDFFIFITRAIISHTRAYKNSVRSVRFQYSCGFQLFALVFALLFAIGFAVRSWKNSVKNGIVA